MGSDVLPNLGVLPSAPVAAAEAVTAREHGERVAAAEVPA